MICPHCCISFHDAWDAPIKVGQDSDGCWWVKSQKCPTCNNIIVILIRSSGSATTSKGETIPSPILHESLVRPKAANRPPCPVEVPSEIAEDYSEACLVLPDSPKASAALSRRCLQTLIREHFSIKERDLSTEIEKVISLIPSYIAQNVDAIRNVGNFAAHPLKSQQTGQVLPVEPNEAEWTLDVLEQLFDFCYVQPAIAQAKRDALNQKLQEARKPCMK